MIHESEFDDEDEEVDDDIIDLDDPDAEPFVPPADYQFEPEFDAPVPRPCPPEVRWGRYTTLQQRQVAGLLIGGAACMAVSRLQFIEILSNYILPLQFLLPLGLILGVSGVGLIVARRFLPGRYRYVIEGEPMVAQIRQLSLEKSGKTQAEQLIFNLIAEIHYADPVNGEHLSGICVSNPIGIAQRPVLRSTYRVGDYVTAVYLPNHPDQPPVLYGFLELRNDIGVVLRDGKVLDSWPRMIASLVFLFAFFGSIGWAIYAFGAFSPIQIDAADVWRPLGIGAVLIGLPLYLLFRWSVFGRLKRSLKRDERADAEERPNDPIALSAEEVTALSKQHWVATLFLMLIICGCGAGIYYIGCLSVNALADRSPPVKKPIVIESLVVKTHRGMIREYEVEYRFLDNRAVKYSRATSPEEMVGLVVGQVYQAEVQAGYFGWPWVKAIAR